MPKHNLKSLLMNQTLCSHRSYKIPGCGKGRLQTLM
jgi:hypothetical protein